MGAVGHAVTLGLVSVYIQQFFKTQAWVSGADRQRDGMCYVIRPCIHVFAFGYNIGCISFLSFYACTDNRNNSDCMRFYLMCVDRIFQRTSWIWDQGEKVKVELELSVCI